jgi:hypothetical protein
LLLSALDLIPDFLPNLFRTVQRRAFVLPPFDLTAFQVLPHPFLCLFRLVHR